MTDTETRVAEWNGENGWEQLDLPLPNQAQLLAEDAIVDRRSFRDAFLLGYLGHLL